MVFRTPRNSSLDDHHDLLDELARKIAKYNAAFDRELVTRAFDLAVAQHREQRRASGEAYINHPVGTASICADLRLDSATIAAALLHDVVEDTGMSIEAVRAEFGDEVALLVDGVTKLSQIGFPYHRRGTGGEHPQDDHRDGQGHPRDPHQAGGPSA